MQSNTDISAANEKDSIDLSSSFDPAKICPSEITKLIFSFFNNKDLASLSQVSKTWMPSLFAIQKNRNKNFCIAPKEQRLPLSRKDSFTQLANITILSSGQIIVVGADGASRSCYVYSMTEKKGTDEFCTHDGQISFRSDNPVLEISPRYIGILALYRFSDDCQLRDAICIFDLTERRILKSIPLERTLKAAMILPNGFFAFLHHDINNSFMVKVIDDSLSNIIYTRSLAHGSSRKEISFMGGDKIIYSAYNKYGRRCYYLFDLLTQEEYQVNRDMFLITDNLERLIPIDKSRVYLFYKNNNDGYYAILDTTLKVISQKFPISTFNQLPTFYQSTSGDYILAGIKNISNNEDADKAVLQFKLEIWDIQTGRKIHRQVLKENCHQLKFLQSGELIALLKEQDVYVQLWLFPSGNDLSHHQTNERNAGGFSPAL